MSRPARRAPTVLLVVGVLVSCLRAPIGDDHGDGSVDFGSSGRPDEHDSTGLGASDSALADDGSAETSPEGTCHPSYLPCLPIVDDLDCSDVIALEAAPVTVIGADDYDLDSDHDGVGCEP